MNLTQSGYYVPGHKPEPSTHEKQAKLRLAARYTPNSFAMPLATPDLRPLPFVKNGCFKNEAEKKAADRQWRNTYQRKNRS